MYIRRKRTVTPLGIHRRDASKEVVQSRALEGLADVDGNFESHLHLATQATKLGL